MRRILKLALFALLGAGIGCSNSPEVKKLNDDAKQARDNAGVQLKEAADAVGEAAAKEAKVAGQELEDAAASTKEAIDDAVDKASRETK